MVKKCMNIILISSLVVASSIIMARKHGKAIIVTMTMTTTSVVPRKSTTRFVTCGHWHRLCIHSIYRCEALRCRRAWRRMERTQAKLPTWTMAIGVVLLVLLYYIVITSGFGPERWLGAQIRDCLLEHLLRSTGTQAVFITLYRTDAWSALPFRLNTRNTFWCQK